MSQIIGPVIEDFSGKRFTDNSNMELVPAKKARTELIVSEGVSKAIKACLFYMNDM